MAIEIEADKRGLIVKTPYSPMFISELKRIIPASDRQFDGPSKAWIVSPQYGQAIQKLIMTVYKVAVHVPDGVWVYKPLERASIRLEYLGQCKQRLDGTVSAFGHDGHTWAVIVPESVLRAFFGSDVSITVEGEETRSKANSAPSTLYAALLVKPNAGPLELKAAWKRMARLTHPDVNHEPDAAEQFKAVQRAYELLSDPVKRKRYDAGLALEASLAKKEKATRNVFDLSTTFFRAPLRCGLLTVDGEQKLGRLVVSRIHSWNDITNERGQVMVSSWNSNRETYEVTWA